MIDTQAIRSKILDLAIQGRLSTNNPNECAPCIPTVDDVIPDRDIPYSIPANWIWVKLGGVMGIERGGSPRPIKEYLTTDENGINWIKIGDVAKNGKYIESTKEKIKPEGEKKSRRVFPGDFLLTNSMSFGRPYISRIEGCIHDGWLVLRNSYSLFFYDFLYYLLSSPYAYAQFSRKASGSTVDNLNIEKVSEAIVPIPPIDEQKRIVDRIESALSIVMSIDLFQEQYADNLSVLKSKLIDAAIQGKLTEQLPEDGTAEQFLQEISVKKEEIEKSGVLKGRKKKTVLPIPDIELPFAIPKTWKWIRLATVAEIFGRIGFRGYTKNDIVEQGKGAISLSPSNITKEGQIVYNKNTYISWEKYDESPEIMVENEDILIVKTGSSYGKCAVVKTLPEKATINPQLAILKYVLCNRYYLHYILVSSMAHKQYEEFVIGAATPTFSQENLANFLLPLPPIDEQKRIVQKLDEILPLCEKL